MAVSFHTVTEHEVGQRIDNFLLKHFRKVPKSVIYRIVRKGEVRIDKKRVKPDRKLALGEEIRIPPVKVDTDAPNRQEAPAALLEAIERAIVLEDDYLIVLNKPAGIAVHGGSGVKHGLIEVFRQLRPNLPFVELVHRLDRDTSGLLLLAKSRKVLNALHDLLRTGGGMQKHYQALVAGQWRDGRQHVIMELERGNGGRQKVQVVEHAAKTAESIFTPETVLGDCTLMDVQILTGRMHQIRVQLAQMEHPVLGDDRYGDFALNREYKKLGLKRLFLHAAYLEFMLDLNGHRYRLEAPLPQELNAVLKQAKRRS